MKKSNIAILGSTSHIAKGLIRNFLDDGECGLELYTRSPQKLRAFLDGLEDPRCGEFEIHEGYQDLSGSSHDVIINSVGVGPLNNPESDYSSWFTVTEKYDNMAIEYLHENTDALYISFSSGAVYGRGHSGPVEESTVNSIRVNHVGTEDYYAIARLNAEAKHRSFKDLNIIDLRLFSYFSRYIDLADGYFITEVLDSVLNNRVLATDGMDIVRDYLHPKDLFSIVRKCMDAGKINTAFDVKSASPAKKFEILDYFSAEYGLKYEVRESLELVSGTGPKNIYCSNYNKALEIGYKPEFNSMDAIKQESGYILHAF